MNFKTILFFIFTLSPIYWNSSEYTLKNLFLTVFYIIVCGFSFLIVYYLLCMLLPEVLSDIFDWLKVYYDKMVSKYSKKKIKRVPTERQLRRRRIKKAFFISQQQSKDPSKRFYCSTNRFIAKSPTKIFFRRILVIKFRILCWCLNDLINRSFRKWF